MGRVHVASEHAQDVEARVRLHLQQHGDIVPIDFDAHRWFDDHRGGLVRRSFEHGREAKQLARFRFAEHHLLVILIDGSEPHLARHHHVSSAAGIADFVNALERCIFLALHLRGQHRQLFLIEQLEERHVFQCIGITGHRLPLKGLGDFNLFSIPQGRWTRQWRAARRRNRIVIWMSAGRSCAVGLALPSRPPRTSLRIFIPSAHQFAREFPCRQSNAAA